MGCAAAPAAPCALLLPLLHLAASTLPADGTACAADADCPYSGAWRCCGASKADVASDARGGMVGRLFTLTPRPFSRSRSTLQFYWPWGSVCCLIQTVLILLAAFLFRACRRGGDHAI